MGIIMTNDDASFRPLRPTSPKMKPDEVEETKGKVKKLPADNTGATMTMSKNMFVQGGSEVRPNGMAKQEDAGEMCADCLKGCIADMLAFYMKAHQYHWNVMGQDFAQYHELFGEIYADAHKSLDTFAEFLRAMGYMAPFNPTQVAEMTHVQETSPASTPSAMASDLYMANVYIQDKLMSLYHKAEAAMNHGLSNFVQDRMAAHQKWGWQLGASLGMPEFTKATE